jgi:hypothetical protein
MQMRPEHELIIRCARTDLRPSDHSRILDVSRLDLDWSEFLRAAIPHGLSALLRRHLEPLGGQTVPVWVLDRLRAESVRATAKSLYLSRQLLEILRRLEFGGIDAIPFKGPTLAIQAYGDLSLRSFADLDILVRERDVPAAREVLLSDGYVSPLDLTPAQFHALLRSGYNDELFRASDGVKVELHWRFAPAYFGFRADLDGWWERCEGVLLDGVRVRGLAREDLLVLLCVHGARHAWASLEGVVAVAELIGRTPDIDWGSTLSRAEQAGAARMVRLGLLLAIDLLDAQVPGTIVAQVRADRQLAVLAAKVRNSLFDEIGIGTASLDESENFSLLSFHLSSKDHWRDRARFCSRMLATATERDWKAATLPDALFPLYGVIRPFRLLARLPKYGRWLIARSR